MIPFAATANLLFTRKTPGRMGFYIRKSIRVGPLRFNLSRSGIGVSAGIRGFRFGTGPRGNYVHVGRHGIYYRATIPAASAPRRLPDPVEVSNPANSTDLLQEVESGDVAAMRDSSSVELLGEFDRKRKTMRLAPAVGVAGILGVALALYGGSPLWLSVTTIVVGAGAFLAARIGDALRKTVVLFYELEGEAEQHFQSLHRAFELLRSSGSLWHVEARGQVRDRKRNAGADVVERRKRFRPSTQPPPFVKTNIEVPAIPLGGQTLYLFPDRILVFAAGGVGTVSYADLQIDRCATRFIEEGLVPADAKVVDRTWRYVNKKGGPDKRFKDNREIPVVLYEELHLTSPSGLNEIIQASRPEAGQELEEDVKRRRSAKSA